MLMLRYEEAVFLMTVLIRLCNRQHLWKLSDAAIWPRQLTSQLNCHLIFVFFSFHGICRHSCRLFCFTVPPLDVHMLLAERALLSARTRYDLVCQSSGSRPPATITWWKDGHRLSGTKETVSRTNQRTTQPSHGLRLSKHYGGINLVELALLCG